MTILPINIYPDPILKEVAKPVTSFDASLAKLIDDMLNTMRAAKGIGLAANQVGKLQRVFVADTSEDRDSPLEFVNPEIVESSGKVSSEEGCLSIPEFRDTISRKKEILIRAQNRHGDYFEIETDGILAICAQHELDHLDGILFIDHLSRLKLELFRRWCKKNLNSDKPNL